MTAKLTARSSFLDFGEVLRDREDFDTQGSLRGTRLTASMLYDMPYRYGRLPAEYRDSVDRADYVVYSYDTPIAWHIPGDRWHMPLEGYSKTTTRHQNKVMVALAAIGEVWKKKEVEASGTAQ